MRRFDQTSALCQVFTYKEGPLSYFAHDLRINVTSFAIEIEEVDRRVNARFDASSLRVDCAMAEGIERPDALSESDKREINSAILNDVLHSETYKEIVLVSSSVADEESSYGVRGELSLHGRTRTIDFTVRTEGGYHILDLWLHLPDYGIKPFTALLGAIKIKPDVLIHAEIPAAD